MFSTFLIHLGISIALSKYPYQHVKPPSALVAITLTESSEALLVLSFHMSNEFVAVANNKVQAGIVKDDDQLECRVAVLPFIWAFKGLLQPKLVAVNAVGYSTEGLDSCSMN